jgi:peptide/nickel transport system permease protein
MIVLALWLLAACMGGTAPTIDLQRALAAPARGLWLGADPLGRSLWDLLRVGARTAALVALVSVTLSATVGALLGAIAGLSGGVVDTLVTRAADVVLAFPGMLLALMLTAVLGPGELHMAIAFALTGWPGYARLARAHTMALRGEDFVAAAWMLGASPLRIMVRHLVPNLAVVVVARATVAVAEVILAESGLSFLGLGSVDRPSWGSQIAAGARIAGTAPHVLLVPALALFAVTWSLQTLGDGDQRTPGRQSTSARPSLADT